MSTLRLFTRHTTPIIALALLMVLIAIGIRAHSFWQEFTNEQQVITRKMAQPEGKAPQRSPTEIVSLHLFGQPAAVSREPPEEEKNLPETRLKLVLRGVSSADFISSGTSQRNLENSNINNSEFNSLSVGGALIEGPDRVTEFFRLGSNLPGNAKLHAVYADRIVIDRKGKLENLSFPDDWAKSAGIESFNNTPAGDTGYSENTVFETNRGARRNTRVGGNAANSQDGLTAQARMFEERVMMGQAESLDGSSATDETNPDTETAAEDQRQVKSRLQDLRDLIRKQRTQ